MNGDRTKRLYEFREENGPAIRLYDLMSETSEDCYCAGWLIGTEFVLWDIAHQGGGDWGIGTVSPETAARLLSLSAECGGRWWWCGGDGTDWGDEDGPYLISVDEWKPIFDRSYWGRGGEGEPTP